MRSAAVSGGGFSSLLCHHEFADQSHCQFQVLACDSDMMMILLVALSQFVPAPSEMLNHSHPHHHRIRWY
jgi:hypothetical protein